MFSSKKMMLAAVACILGFMLVLQFQTTNQPQEDTRDTRDVWQLRKDLSHAKMRTSKLNNELFEVEHLLAKYQSNEDHQKVETMKSVLNELKKEAGLTQVSGQGIIIHVEPLVSGSLIGEPYHPITAQLLRRLINELDAYGAKEIAIAGQRVIATTPIRNVNGEIYVNDKSIPEVPFKIKVLTDNARKLHNEMVVSDSRREFAEAKLNLTTEPVDHLVLPAYDQPILVQYMEPAKGES
ncbi:MAG TPA: DUF881 domain-containing protein [Bacillales bacterium]|nr:DUF881 domain-containing protein [Bacillales bacterium]